MGYVSKANQLRASSSAFQWGDLVYTTYKTGCLRKILVQARGYESAIDPKYAIVGKANEDRHEAKLTRAGLRFEREVAFERPVPDVDPIVFSGHADFILYSDRGVPDSVDELKSVSSTNVRRAVIRNGEYLVENLAQTVRYMMEARVVRGRLIYTFWEKGEATEERLFAVGIDDWGRIHVDSKPTQFTVYDLMAHERRAAEAIRDGVVGPRPYRGEAPFVGCCNYCPFKDACNQFDTGIIEGGAAFVEYAKNGATKEVSNV